MICEESEWNVRQLLFLHTIKSELLSWDFVSHSIVTDGAVAILYAGNILQ